MNNVNNDEDLYTISFDKIYPSGNSWYAMNDSEKLLTTNSDNCCDKIRIWLGCNNNENNCYSCIYKLFCIVS